MPGHVHHARDNSYIFVGSKRGAPLSNTAMLELMRTLRPDYVPRGSRSTFGDWAASAPSSRAKPEAALRLSLAFPRKRGLRLHKWDKQRDKARRLAHHGEPARLCALARAAPTFANTQPVFRGPHFANAAWLGHQHIFYTDGKIAHALARRVKNGVGDSGRHADEGDFAEALNAERIDVRVLLVDEVRLELRDIKITGTR